MKSILSIVGVLLIIFGIFTFAYHGFTYTKREKVAEIGSVQITADQEKTVWFSPMTSGISIVAGIVLVVVGRIGRNDK